MITKKIYISLLMLLFVYPSITLALTLKEKGRILSDFKELEYEMIFESALELLDKDDKKILSISRKMNIFESIKLNVAEQRKDIEKKQEYVINKIVSLEAMIKSLDDDIANTLDEVNRINDKIIVTKKKVGINTKTIKLLGDKILNNKKILLEYLVYIYAKSNSVYDKNYIDNLKTILLTSNDIWWIIDDLYYKWIIEITWKQLIDKHRDYVRELYLKKISLEKQNTELKDLRKKWIIEKKILKDKKKFKQRILTVSKWKESLYKKFISDKLKIEKNLRLKELKEKIKFNNIKKKLLSKYDCDFVDIWKKWADVFSLEWKCLDLNKVIYSESKLKWFNKEGSNILSWPISAYHGISSYFHDQEYKNMFWDNHDAIDIVTAQWTSIKAPADWYVVYLLPPLTTDYAYIALKHSDWYVTVYWHISNVLVKELDFVKKWEIFAETGWEYGTMWAGLMTTWPHLHMELFRDKEIVDPLSYMDVSVLKFEDLPQKYRFKFYVDYKERKWFDYKTKKERTKLFKLKWITEVERQKSLISKYATTAFSDWDVWVEESLDWWIDPTFVMCLGLAESWLWKHMKTPFNVWNVWNTDSWATKTFWNARFWIYQIVSTLNNKYLGHYNEIKDLSRYWNKDGAIYASSANHWHNNIVKCMSHIKGRYVPDNYSFRILK